MTRAQAIAECKELIDLVPDHLRHRLALVVTRAEWLELTQIPAHAVGYSSPGGGAMPAFALLDGLPVVPFGKEAP